MAKSEEARGNWARQLEFLLSAIGFSVGVGGVWRFPYLAYRNGGASFLIPYVIMLITAGLPLCLVELAIGQFASQGPITVWAMAPFFVGIGYAMVSISFMVSIYYNMIITYAIYYMLVSFVHLDDNLPWEKCDHPWNTNICRDISLPRLDEMSRENATMALWDEIYKKPCVNQLFKKTTYKTIEAFQSFIDDFNSFNQSSGDIAYYNSTTNIADTLTWDTVQDFDGFDDCKISYTSPSEEYFERHFLHLQNSDDLSDLGDIRLTLLITRALTMLLIFGCLMRGVKTSGKVVYFTATFPYAILIVLLIRGLTLEGYEDGVKFYVVPEWDKLTNARIWGEAATQIFYSLGIGFGGLVNMASYNKFHNNCYNDAIVVALANTGTSIFAGFAIFSMLGHMAHETDQKVADVATSGPGLAFVAYPDGISRLPASPVWSFLFFFMLLNLGLNNQITVIETIASGISDVFPSFLRRHKTSFTFIYCVIAFLLGIPICMEGGIRVLTLMNDFSGSYNLLVIALFEIICIFAVYGTKNFREDIEMMIGFKPGLYWIANWLVISPAVIILIIVLSAIQYKTPDYDGQKFSDWAEGLGWLMVAVPIFLMVMVGVIQVFRLGWRESLTPMKTWGPSQPEHRTGRYAPLHDTSADFEP